MILENTNNSGYEGHKISEEIVLLYARDRRLTMEFFSEYLAKIERGEQTVLETQETLNDVYAVRGHSIRCALVVV